MFAQRFLGSPPDKHCNWMAKLKVVSTSKKIDFGERSWLFTAVLFEMGVSNIDTGEMQGFI